MNVLDTVLAAEQKATNDIAVAESNMHTALEKARKTAQDRVVEAQNALAQEEVSALKAKEADIEKKVQTIATQASTTVAAIAKNFESKKNSALAAVKKYFA